MQTYRHRLASSGVGLSLQTNRSKHIGVTQLPQMPGLLPRASWRVYICQLLPSGPGSRLTSCRSWAVPALLPQPCCTSGKASARILSSALPSPLHLPSLSVSCLPPSWLEKKKKSVLHFENHIQVTQCTLVISTPTAPSFSSKHPNMSPPPSLHVLTFFFKNALNLISCCLLESELTDRLVLCTSAAVNSRGQGPCPVQQTFHSSPPHPLARTFFPIPLQRCSLNPG